MNLTCAKSGFGVAINKLDNIYVVGGNDGEKILSTLEIYDYHLRKVSKLAEMKEKRDELAVTIGSDNKIYAIGNKANIILKIKDFI
jgi:hypothetical protein